MKYSIDEARLVIADHGFIAKVSAQGGVLVVYEGEEHLPGSWMEIGRCAIKDGKVASSSIASVVG